MAKGEEGEFATTMEVATTKMLSQLKKKLVRFNISRFDEGPAACGESGIYCYGE